MKTYSHLDCTKRAAIQLRLEQGQTVREIASSLDPSPSTVSRELARNG